MALYAIMLYTAYNVKERSMENLSESGRLLYAQLLSQCLHGAAPSGRGFSFVSKRIRGGVHWYLQLTVGSRKTQHYLGPDTDTVREMIAKEKALWEKAKPDLTTRERLVAMLASGGAHGVGGAEARVLELLERVGVFLVGGVLVSSLAFAVYGNMLGVRWDTETTRTEDVDIAGDRHVQIVLSDKPVRLRDALLKSDMGFIEAPALDRKSPSTKFRIRGRELSVDLLTPMMDRTSDKPIHLAAFDTYAEPVRFLDYVMEDAQPAVIVAKAGILVNVPSPARYVIHKLVVSQRRAAAFQVKGAKDVGQAEQLIAVLTRDRPGDLQLAGHAASRQPAKFRQQLQAGIRLLSPESRAQIESVLYKKR